jgi:polysaccharide export outer membrane protein
MYSLYRFVLALIVIVESVALAQPAASAAQQRDSPASAAGNAVAGPGAATDPGFTIGPEDVLAIVFWRDQDMSSEVIVRSDGMITIPIIRDVKAAGLTPTALADKIQEAAREFVTDASVTVVVRQMNSRKVFITGEVNRPGAYSLASSTTVMQLIAIAGGLTEFADSRRISVMRVDGGQGKTFMFDYKDVARGKKRNQNLVLKPGDTVVVPEK